MNIFADNVEVQRSSGENNIIYTIHEIAASKLDANFCLDICRNCWQTDKNLAPSQCVSIGDCILGRVLIQNEGSYPWSHESNFWTLFHGSPILCKYRIKSFTRCLTKRAFRIFPTRVLRVVWTFEIFQPLCVLLRESYATCLLLVPVVESSSSWRPHNFRLVPFPPADSGRSSHCSVVICYLGPWTMSKLSLTTLSVYYRQNPLKTNVTDYIALMAAELLRTRRLVWMIINKGNLNPRRTTHPSVAGAQEHKPRLHAIRNYSIRVWSFDLLHTSPSRWPMSSNTIYPFINETFRHDLWKTGPAMGR